MGVRMNGDILEIAIILIVLLSVYYLLKIFYWGNR